MALLLILCGSVAYAVDTSDVLIVDLYLNYQHMGESFVLKGEREGEFYLDEGVLQYWQISDPWPQPRDFLGNKYYGIHQFPGVSVKLDQRDLSLHVSIPPALLPVNRVNLRGDNQPVPTTHFGAYMDYDFGLTGQQAGGIRSASGLFRPVVFGPMGSINANVLLKQVSTDIDTVNTASQNGATVLDLTFARDDPYRMRSLRIGDIITKSSRIGRALRFGGIQLATNFGTQPSFITYPLPEFFGQTEVPTALDVYVNGQLTRRENVRPGPYVLQDVPVVNGAGQLQVVSRDALGRQQVFTQDFYLAIDLLKEGLNDYSFNVGALREDYGLENFSYGDAAASATWRHGLRQNLTIEGHGEITNDLAMISGGGQYQIDAGGILSSALGISTSSKGPGARMQVGFQQILSAFSYNIEVAAATPDFALVADYGMTPHFQLLTTGAVNLESVGSIGLAVVHQKFQDRADRSVISLNHGMNIARRLSLTTSLSYVAAEFSGFTAGIRFSMPLGDRHNVNGGLTGRSVGSTADVSVRRYMPAGPGYGYHLGIGAGDSTAINAGVIAQNEVGSYYLDARNSEGVGYAWQIGSYGSVAHLDGMTSFSRQIRDAFAVVNVGNFEGVRVYSENQVIGRTDRNGQLFVPGLLPYMGNQLRIEANDLPLNASVSKTQAVTTPYYRSGVVVDFGVKISRDAIMRVVSRDGVALPEGAVATIVNKRDQFPVGLDGKLYLRDIGFTDRVEIRWNAATCIFDLPDVNGDSIIPDLGDIVCELR